MHLELEVSLSLSAMLELSFGRVSPEGCFKSRQCGDCKDRVNTNQCWSRRLGMVFPGCALKYCCPKEKREKATAVPSMAKCSSDDLSILRCRSTESLPVVLEKHE